MVVNVQVYCSFIGNTGWNNHVRDFLSNLNHDILNVKVTNFTVDDNFKNLNGLKPFEDLEYLTDTHRNMLHEQLLWNGKSLERFPIYSHQRDFIPEVILVFAEVDHHLYYQDFYDENIPKIAYTVWETTKLPEKFFNKLQEFDELWVPSKWQKKCHIGQGYPEHKLRIVNEGVDSKLFNSENLHNQPVFKHLVVGRWDDRKSTKDIIKSWLKVFPYGQGYDNLELLLLVDNFDNPQDGYKNTQERLKGYGLEDSRIIVFPYSDREKYSKLLKSVDIVLTCSRGEGWNLPLIESIASGTPVIYSKVGGQLEYTSGVGFGINIKNEIPAWKDDIGKLYDPDWEQFEHTLLSFVESQGQLDEKYDITKQQALKKSKEIRERYDWSVCGKLGTNYLTRIRKFSNEITPSYVTHIRPHENLESYKDNWIPKINKVKGEFMTTTIDWNDVFICNGKDATTWGTQDNGYGDTMKDFTIMMRGDIFPDYHLENEELEMIVKFYDMDVDMDNPYSVNKIKPGYWCRAGRDYFTNWRVTVEEPYNNNILFEYKMDSLKDMNVLIHSVFGLGDTLAWFPYVEEFRKKHDCNIYYNGGYSHWLQDNYPKINFIESGEPGPKCHLGYELGWNWMAHSNKDIRSYEPMDKNFGFPNSGAPRNYQKIPLQASAADMLGLEYNGYLRTHITAPKPRHKKYRPIKEKYVTICTQSTTQAKYWNYGWDYEKMWTGNVNNHIHNADGWHKVIKYLDTLGYKVIVLNQYKQYGSPDKNDESVTEQLQVWNLHDFSEHPNVIDKTNDYISLDDRMIDLMFAEFHIGLNSGLSWVAKTIGTPIIMIPGLHPPDIIPIGDKYVTQDDPDICTNCALDYAFVRGDWGNCPKHQHTEREFECTSTITPKMVTDTIQEFIDENNYTFTEYEIKKSFDKINVLPYICRVKFTPFMLAGYLERGLVIGFYEDSKILSRNSKPWSVDILGKRLGRSVQGDIKNFRSDMNDVIHRDKKYYDTFSEYEKITGKTNLIITDFKTPDVNNVNHPDKVMKLVFDREIDMVVMGDYLYSIETTEYVVEVNRQNVVLQQSELAGKTNKESFTRIYEIENAHGAPCGGGSILDVVESRGVITEIQNIIKKYNIKSVNMIAGGTFGNWEYKVGYKELGVDYHGYEIVEEQVEKNNLEYSDYSFSQLDMTKGVCRKADLIICRDVFQHISTEQALDTIENFKKSGSKYLLISHWDVEHNCDILPNDFIKGYSFFTPKNLHMYPYNLNNVVDFFQEYTRTGTHTPLSPLYNGGRPIEDITEKDPNQYLVMFRLS